LTPAEQLLYRSLKVPSEWRSEHGWLKNDRLGVVLHASNSKGWRAFQVAYELRSGCGSTEVLLGKFAKKRLHPLASLILYPPPLTKKEAQKRFFEHLMKAELGEK
jgi:hypothetical protein